MRVAIWSTSTITSCATSVSNRARRAARPQSGSGSLTRCGSGAIVDARRRHGSTELDVAVECHCKLQLTDLERHLRCERLVASERARGETFRNGLLDLALRTHADHLEKLANAEIQCLVVHRDLRSVVASRLRRLDLQPPHHRFHGGGIA